MTETFFAIVIGAGPSGAATASVLREQTGLDVALVDREIFPRDKSCGDGLGPGVMYCIERLDLSSEFELLNPIRTVAVSGPSGIEASGHLPNIGGRPAIGYVVPRKKFDNMLFKKATSVGAQDFSGHSCESITYDDQTCLWTVSLSAAEGGQKKVITARVIVGADGATSKVRRLLGIPFNSSRTTGVGIRSYGKIENFTNELRLDFIRPLLPAYGWVFPLGNDTVNFGVGIDSDRLKQSNRTLQNLLDEYKSWANNRFGVNIDLSDEKSAPLPYAVPLPRLGFPNTPAALVGDAASMINPLTGEGIFYGMQAGITCAEFLHSAYRGEKSLPQALGEYERHFRNRFNDHFATNWKMKKRVASPAWSDLVVKACARDKSIMDELVELMMGDKKRISNKMVMKIGMNGIFG